MIRLLGFLVGSLLSIAALVLLIGTPDFHLGASDADVARFDAAVEKLKSKQALLQAAADTGEAGMDDPLEAPPAQGDPAAPAGPEMEGVAVQAGPPGRPEAKPDETEAEPPVTPAEPEWHAFWTPFRTEIAARGFISRLERVTGLDYRVLKTDRDRYQVAFSYASDDELDSKLSQISAATGLQLSGQLPR